MLSHPTALLALVLIAGGERAAVTPAEFRGWFDRAAEGRLAIPDDVRERACGLRYVFVGGLSLGRMRGYFDQNIDELKAIGVPASSIHMIQPGSDEGLDENLGAIREGLLDAADAGPERLVILAHSRGACESLAFALREPGFVRDRVAAMFLVQGPFGGSGLADYVLGEGEPMDRRMPRRARVVARTVGGLARASIRRGRHAGLEELTRDEAAAFWSEELEEHAAAIPTVGPRTFFVETSVSPSRQRFLRKPLARYLDHYYGPSDGVVLASDQSLEGIGTRLGPLDVGHTDLTRKFPGARARPALRHALVRSIVMAVGREGLEAPDRD